MAPIEIYVTRSCPYCHAAKRLLVRKGAEFTEIDVSGDPQRRGEMVARASGCMTVPQIFIGETHVGGCDDLYALDQAGKLDALLNDSPAEAAATTSADAAPATSSGSAA
jgi:glutaredoxin 3